MALIEALVLKDLMSGALDKIKEKVIDVASHTKLMSGVNKDAAGKLRDLKGRFISAGDAANSYGNAAAALGGPIGMAVTGVVTLTTAFVGLTVAGAALAVEQTELESKLRTTFAALAGGEAAGAKTLGMLDEMSSKLPQTRDQLAAWTKSYMALGIVDQGQLKSQLTATASAAALAGDEGAAAFEKLTKKIQTTIETGQALKIPVKGLGSLADMGLRVEDVAQKMGVSAQTLGAQLKAGSVDASKFGAALNSALVEKGAGPLEEMAESLPNQIAKAKEAFARMFDVGGALKPFLHEMRGLLGIIDQANPSGRAMSATIKGFFSGVFSLAAKAVPIVRQFFLQLMIYGLKGYIAIKPILGAFKGLLPYLGPVWTGIKAIATVAAVLVGVGLALSAAILGIGAAMSAGLYAAIGLVADGFSWLINEGPRVAGEFIAGLVGGITGGVGKAVEAVKGLGSSLLDGIQGVLGIHSPSVEAAKLGRHVPAGFARGVSAGMGEIGDAASSMGSATLRSASTPVAAPSVSSGGGGGLTVNVEPGAIVIDGAGKSAEDITEEMIARLFERVALSQGLGA